MPLEYLYDLLIDGGGTPLRARSPRADYARPAWRCCARCCSTRTPSTGLSDAGAHVNLICDGTMPTTQLTHWTRDRNRGEQLPLEFMVAQADGAQRRALRPARPGHAARPGMRADLNVDRPRPPARPPPVAHDDLPAGGTRLISRSTGYIATLCNGVRTRDHDADTGARPGRLVRGT